VAAAGVIVGAFEAVKLAIGRPETDGRDERREIGAGGILDGARMVDSRNAAAKRRVFFSKSSR
jgi:hypothetical protein